MADTNRTRLSYGKETTFGTIPAIAFQNVRMTSESLTHGVETTVSAEIRSDRNTTDLVQTGANPSGGWNFELSLDNPSQDLIAGALWSSWTNRLKYEAADDITVANSGSTMTSAADITNFNTTFEVGQIVKTSGFGETANNGYHVLTAVAASVLTMTGSTLTDESPVSQDVNIWAEIGATGDIYVDADGGVSSTNAYLSTSTDFTKQKLAIGRWIKVSGFATSGNNGWKRITNVATNVLSVYSPGATMVDEAAGTLNVVMIPADYIRNGTTESNFTFERYNSDVSTYFAFRGMTTNTFGITASSKSIVTGNLDYVGKNLASTDVGTSPYGTGTNVEAPTEDVMNAVANVGNIMEYGATIASDVVIKEVSFTINNNVRGIDGIGTLGNIDIGVGNCDVTGNMNMLFKDKTFYDRFISNTASSISFKVEDSSNNCYIFDFPRVKYESGDGPQASGKNSDSTDSYAWRAILDSDWSCEVQISRYCSTDG